LKLFLKHETGHILPRCHGCIRLKQNVLFSQFLINMGHLRHRWFSTNPDAKTRREYYDFRKIHHNCNTVCFDKSFKVQASGCCFRRTINYIRIKGRISYRVEVCKQENAKTPKYCPDSLYLSSDMLS